jgi:hypothetical protein
MEGRKRKKEKFLLKKSDDFPRFAVEEKMPKLFIPLNFFSVQTVLCLEIFIKNFLKNKNEKTLFFSPLPKSKTI